VAIVTGAVIPPVAFRPGPDGAVAESPSVTSAPRRPLPPTFADYIPIIDAAVTDGTRRAYGSYGKRINQHWGHRRIDEPTPSEIKHLVEQAKINLVPRRNARGGRSAGEHLIAALRCLYRHAEHDGLITPTDNPASIAGPVCHSVTGPFTIAE
jgi:hypothetical protein